MVKPYEFFNVCSNFSISTLAYVWYLTIRVISEKLIRSCSENMPLKYLTLSSAHHCDKRKTENSFRTWGLRYKIFK